MFAQQPNLPCKAMAAIEKRTYPALIQFLYRGTSEPEWQMLLWGRKTSREFVRWGLGSARRVAPVVFDVGIV